MAWIFTQQQWAKDNLKTVSAFKKASLKGWKYAMANKPDIIELIHQKFNSKKSRAHLAYEAGAMEKLIMPEFVEIGHVNPGRWDSIASVFVRHGVIKKDYSLAGFIISTHPDSGRFEKERSVPGLPGQALSE